MFSSKNQVWETRQEYFDKWNKRFGFSLDVCSSPGSQKCDKYFSPEDDGLSQSWMNEVFWCNSPYSREQAKWVKYGIEQGASGVFLLPSRTDTKLYHEWLEPNCKIEFIKGRLIFGSDDHWKSIWADLQSKIDLLDENQDKEEIKKLKARLGKMAPAPFPSLLAILNM